MYKCVRQLTAEQLDELKWVYFYSDDYKGCFYPHWQTGELVPVLFASDIPDEVIFEVFDGIVFTNDDFGCTAGMDD